MKKFITALISVAMTLAFAGCNGDIKNQESKELTANDGYKKAVLVVSFGTSYNETRVKTIDAIENKIADEFSDYDVRRAFTSQIIIDKLAERDNLQIDNVAGAMQKLVDENYKELIVQPTHVMNGLEYTEMLDSCKPFESSFEKIAYGEPLMISDDDYDFVSSAILEFTKDYDAEKTAVVFMGHGTTHEANSTYQRLDNMLKDQGHGNYFMGTVEASPTIDDIIPALEAGGYTKVVLLPFMIVAGDHATNDMASDEEGSWKTILKQNGFEVECVITGLGEYPAIQDLFVLHARNAETSLL
ncbi:MAG: sirohydrochlorin cobaltochelatase [Eubacterium sp.]|jgi:sirohydrochlorin cobaltochelatase|nr:sirohydrochlorin cobaltochelatase [Eubacterium sp.]